MCFCQTVLKANKTGKIVLYSFWQVLINIVKDQLLKKANKVYIHDRLAIELNLSLQEALRFLRFIEPAVNNIKILAEDLFSP